MAHHRTLYLTLLLILPFIALNMFVVNQIEPFASVIRLASESLIIKYVLIFGTLLLAFGGGLVSLSVLFHKEKSVKKKSLYIVNILIGIGLILTTTIIMYKFAEESYRCDVQKIENCD